MKRAYFAFMLGAAVLATACSDSTTATRLLTPGAPSAAVVPASGKIDQSNQVGTTDACVAGEWHWIINGLANAGLAPATITAHFATGDVVVPLEKFTGGAAHYTWTANLTDVLVPPYATATLAAGTVYTRFNLSHVPCAPTVQGSSVVTVVHDAGTDAPISDPAALGTSTHDQAKITTTGSAAIPGGSKVTFYFWKTGDCTGEPAFGPSDIAASGASPLTVDGGLPQGPLGAGSYSYQANFTSGDHALVGDSEGACEPFTVNKGELHLTTEVHSATHVAITTAVALGDVVHDFAKVTGEVPGIPKANAIVFTLTSAYSGTCAAGASVANAGAEIPGEKSADNTVAPGNYAFLASLAGDDNYTVKDDTGCEPFTVNKGTLHITTSPHDASHNPTTSVALGSVMHDLAIVTGFVSGFPRAATAFTFSDKGCDAGTPIATLGAEGTDDRSIATSPLGAGSYSFRASIPPNENYDVDPNGDAACEPFTVNKAQLTISTNVHIPVHINITNTSVLVGSVVHDSATFGGVVSGFAPTGTIAFSFYSSPVGATSSTCSTTPTAVAALGALPMGESNTKTITAAGNYAFSATYAGDANYYSVSGDCEPFAVFSLGKSQGFYGGPNGPAFIGNYLTRAVAIGRGSNIDTQGEAAKVLPGGVGACALGSPLIFSPAAQYNATSCTLATGLNLNSLNNGSSQTLALGYNRQLVYGWANPTIGAIGCSAFVTAGLTAASTVTDAFNAAVGLINNSASLGTTTTAILGPMTNLLNCLNREV